MSEKPPSESELRFAILASDVVIFTLCNDELCVRLTKVMGNPYYLGQAALPGGLIAPSETAEEAARRLLKSKAKMTGENPHLEQLHTFSRVDRDKRGRVVAVAYSAFYPWDSLTATEKNNSDEAWWIPINEIKDLAYDHKEILDQAVTHLKNRLKTSTIIQKLLSSSFTLTELQNAYSAILGESLDRRNFQKKILKTNILKMLPEKRMSGRMRPARLYTFPNKTVEELSLF